MFKAIRDIHNQSKEIISYKFSAEALEQLGAMQDKLQQMKAGLNDKNRQGHVVQSIMHLIRLAGILFVMDQATEKLKHGNIDLDSWNTTISVESLQHAYTIVEYTLKQKWALMPPPLEYDDPDSDNKELISPCPRAML